MKKNKNFNVVTGDNIKAALLQSIPTFVSVPGAVTRIGVNGVRIDVPELPPFLLMAVSKKRFYFFNTTSYEINHDVMWAKLTKAEFHSAIDSCRRAVENMQTAKTKNEEKKV